MKWLNKKFSYKRYFTTIPPIFVKYQSNSGQISVTIAAICGTAILDRYLVPIFYQLPITAIPPLSHCYPTAIDCIGCDCMYYRKRVMGLLNEVQYHFEKFWPTCNRMFWNFTPDEFLAQKASKTSCDQSYHHIKAPCDHMVHSCNCMFFLQSLKFRLLSDHFE